MARGSEGWKVVATSNGAHVELEPGGQVVGACYYDRTLGAYVWDADPDYRVPENVKLKACMLAERRKRNGARSGHKAEPYVGLLRFVPTSGPRWASDWYSGLNSTTEYLVYKGLGNTRYSVSWIDRADRNQVMHVLDNRDGSYASAVRAAEAHATRRKNGRLSRRRSRR